MKRRVIGIVMALVLAIAGTALLAGYVKSAKDNAAKGELQVKVLVVQNDIAQGTTLDKVAKDVVLTEMPKRLAATDAVADLSTISPGFVTAIALKAGEQLLTSRLVDPRSLVHVDVPDGLQELTIALSPERALGAELQAGDTVGVLFSFQPFDVSASGAASAVPTPTTVAGAPSGADTAAKTPNTTHFTLHRVLVTGIQLSKADSERVSVIKGTPQSGQTTDTTIAPTVAEAPADQLLITLAVTAAEAEQVVFGAEFGSIWLTNEGPKAVTTGTRLLTLSQVFIPVPR